MKKPSKKERIVLRRGQRMCDWDEAQNIVIKWIGDQKIPHEVLDALGEGNLITLIERVEFGLSVAYAKGATR